MIDEWKKEPANKILERIPIVGLSSRSVPLVSYVELQNDPCFEELLVEKISLVASRTFIYIETINRFIDTVERHIASIYPLRSYTKGIEEGLKANKVDIRQVKVKDIAKEEFNDLFEKCKQLKSDCTTTTSVLISIFADNDFWNKSS